MTNVVTLTHRPHVRLESGRCTGGDTPALVGKWTFLVHERDEEGGHLVDYVGTDRAEADEAAVSWARDHGCRIVDLSAEESA